MDRPLSSLWIPAIPSHSSAKNRHGRQKNQLFARERQVRTLETLEQRQCFATMLPLTESFVQSHCDVPDAMQAESNQAQIRVLVNEQGTRQLGLSRSSVQISTPQTRIEVNTTGQLASFDVEVITEAFEIDVSYLAEESASIPSGELESEIVRDPVEPPALVATPVNTVSTSVHVATDTSIIAIEHSYQEPAEVAQTPICECETPRTDLTVEFEHVTSMSDEGLTESTNLDVAVRSDTATTTEINVAYDGVIEGKSSNVQVDLTTESEDSLVQVDIEHREEMPSTASIPSSRTSIEIASTSVSEPVDSQEPSDCVSDTEQRCCCEANAPVRRADTYSVSISVHDEDSNTELEMNVLTVNREAPNVLLSASIRQDAIDCGIVA